MYFLDADLHLPAGCAAIGAGTAEGAPVNDKDGTVRLQDGTVDAGAYEYSVNAIGNIRLPPDRHNPAACHQLLLSVNPHYTSRGHPLFLLNGQVTGVAPAAADKRLRILVGLE